ncbi:MAG TPA: tetratricopeptide repeat protein [Candidatus Tenderia electrophaga]|uniref:Ancillary SecYEG translocon subunit n=1 Tax=Candidatus Tenderia electrophaga TaxID=1748243 RepID=A0A832J878_9GAMM|nr:tetratricopeptide repeat protein [Candidatus Tenderia electrophaga]
MEVYESEQEQIDAIKKWWKENGKAVIIGAILGFGSLIGWQQWQANTQAQRESASLEYDVLLADLENKKYQQVKDRGARILSNYQDTSYAPLSAMSLAKVYVEEGDFASAKTYLQVAMDQDDQPQLKQIAQLRLARLLLADGDATQALSQLKAMKVGGFAAVVNELEGDIQVALGNRAQARIAYQQALDTIEAGVDAALLQMKLDDVGGPEADS